MVIRFSAALLHRIRQTIIRSIVYYQRQNLILGYVQFSIMRNSDEGFWLEELFIVKE